MGLKDDETQNTQSQSTVKSRTFDPQYTQDTLRNTLGDDDITTEDKDGPSTGGPSTVDKRKARKLDDNDNDEFVMAPPGERFQ